MPSGYGHRQTHEGSCFKVFLTLYLATHKEAFLNNNLSKMLRTMTKKPLLKLSLGLLMMIAFAGRQIGLADQPGTWHPWSNQRVEAQLIDAVAHEEYRVQDQKRQRQPAAAAASAHGPYCRQREERKGQDRGTSRQPPFLFPHHLDSAGHKKGRDAQSKAVQQRQGRAGIE